MASECPRSAARATDRLDLVDEDDRRRHFSGLCEQLPYAAGPDADDHLDELRCARAEERNLRLARRGTGQQRLAGPGRPGEQHTLGSTRTETAILSGILQEVDDFVDLRLHLVDARDIVERHAHRLGIDALLPPTHQAAERSLLTPKHPGIEADEQENRGK